MTASDRVLPPRLVVALVVALYIAFTVFILPLGPLIIWIVAVNPSPDHDLWQRWLGGGFGAFASVLFLAIWLGLLRYNILGRPAVRVAADALHIGATRVDWRNVGTVDSDEVFGVPYLTVEVDKRFVTDIPPVDRLSMRIAAPPDRPRGRLWITEQQLGERVIAAIARLPADHRPDA